MRTATEARARRLLAWPPRASAASLIELFVIALVAVQCARLFWALVTPLGPVGDYQAPSSMRAAPQASLGRFDPFFRGTSAAGPAVVTALDLKLYGVREDRATGRGSAIIAVPGGQQSSFGVGEEIVPGVTLTAVGFDSVTISRGGVAEQLFLDQSTPAPAAAHAAPQAAPSAPAGPQIQMRPRMSAGRVTGIAVMPGGSGDAFRAAGFAPGDVIVSMNGQEITSEEQARALVAQARGEVNLVVDRAGRRLPLRVRLNP